jgi:rhodanese-related sulfurtransferase
VRGARLVLCDTDGTRAHMSASWLAQMGWEVFVLAGLTAEDFTHTDVPALRLPEPQGKVTAVDVAQVKAWLADRNSHTVVLDFSTSAQFTQGHIHSSWWVMRTELQASLSAAHKGARYVLTCQNGHVSRYAVAEVQGAVKKGVEVVWLDGGNAAWFDAGYASEAGIARATSTLDDIWYKPYEHGADYEEQARAYLTWEVALVEQIARDPTIRFRAYD